MAKQPQYRLVKRHRISEDKTDYMIQYKNPGWFETWKNTSYCYSSREDGLSAVNNFIGSTIINTEVVWGEGKK